MGRKSGALYFLKESVFEVTEYDDTRLGTEWFTVFVIFMTMTHIEGIAYGILPDRFSARYWFLDILSYTSWYIRHCFYLIYESSHT